MAARHTATGIRTCASVSRHGHHLDGDPPSWLKTVPLNSRIGTSPAGAVEVRGSDVDVVAAGHCQIEVVGACEARQHLGQEGELHRAAGSYPDRDLVPNRSSHLVGLVVAVVTLDGFHAHLTAQGDRMDPHAVVSVAVIRKTTVGRGPA